MRTLENAEQFRFPLLGERVRVRGLLAKRPELYKSLWRERARACPVRDTGVRAKLATSRLATRRNV